MKVRHSVDLGDGHTIEIGIPTWDDTETQTSIRNRYPTSTGGFSPRSSSEIPLADVRHITVAAADDDLLTEAEIADIMIALSSSLFRRLRRETDTTAP